MGNKFYTIGNIRRKLLEELKKCKFIQTVYEQGSKQSERTVEVTEKGRNAKLKAVIINIENLPGYIEEIRRFELEKVKLEGKKSVEIALVTTLKNELKVFFIELKSSLQSKPRRGKEPEKASLVQIKEKLEDSISRMYFALALTEHLHPNWDKLKVKFVGVVFYLNNNTDKQQDTADTRSRSLQQILCGEKKLPSCKSFLGNEEIPVRFFGKEKEKDSGTIKIDFSALLKIK